MASLRGPRERFLARIERALEGVGQEAAPRLPGKEDIEAKIRSIMDEARSRSEELLEQFVRELELASGKAHRVGSGEEARGATLNVLKEADARRVVLWESPLLKSLGIFDSLRDAGLESITCGPEPSPEKLKGELEGCQAGITEAQFGVAETGTLVLLQGPGRGRLASALPPLHIAILEAGNILPTLHELGPFLRKMTLQEGTLPTCINLVTGPSRTGDIELELALGVHGPKELRVLLIC